VAIEGILIEEEIVDRILSNAKNAKHLAKLRVMRAKAMLLKLILRVTTPVIRIVSKPE
jgi:hypothetical protein